MPRCGQPTDTPQVESPSGWGARAAATDMHTRAHAHTPPGVHMHTHTEQSPPAIHRHPQPHEEHPLPPERVVADGVGPAGPCSPSVMQGRGPAPQRAPHGKEGEQELCLAGVGGDAGGCRGAEVQWVLGASRGVGTGSSDRAG